MECMELCASTQRTETLDLTDLRGLFVPETKASPSQSRPCTSLFLGSAYAYEQLIFKAKAHVERN